MNRELKFKAWHKKYKKMYEVSSLHMATLMNGGIWATVNGRYCIDGKDIKIRIQPTDIIIMQYTGLKDRNGKEIYEGDILLWENEFNRIKIYSLVTFKDGMYLADDAPLCDCLDEVVVGNKFQNPELLEGS